MKFPLIALHIFWIFWSLHSAALAARPGQYNIRAITDIINVLDKNTATVTICVDLLTVTQIPSNLIFQKVSWIVYNETAKGVIRPTAGVQLGRRHTFILTSSNILHRPVLKNRLISRYIHVLESSFNVLLILHNKKDKKEIPWKLLRCAALKIFVYNRNRNKVLTAPATFSPSEITLGQKEIHSLLTEPRKLNKQLLKNAHKKNTLILVSTGIVTTPKYNYVKNYSQSLTICNKLLHKTQAFFCFYEMMAFITLVEAHNLTARFKYRDDWAGRKLLKTLRDPEEYAEYITVRGAQITNKQESVSIRYSRHYKGIDTRYLMYCTFKREIKYIDFEVWTSYPERYTILLVTFFFFLIYIVERSKSVAGVDYCKLAFMSLTAIVRQGTNDKFLLMTTLGLWMSTFYENTLTSILISPPEPGRFSTITEALEHNYKVILQLEYNFCKNSKTDFGENFGWNLSQWPVFKRFEDRFQSFDWQEVKAIRTSARIITERWLHSTYNSDLARTMVLAMKGISKTADIQQAPVCHYIPERLDYKTVVWEIVSRNRDWYASTLSHIQSAGLAEMWDRLAQMSSLIDYSGSYQAYRELQNAKQERFAGDLINMNKFVVPALVSLGLYILACMLFLYECYRNYRRKSIISHSTTARKYFFLIPQEQIRPVKRRNTL